MQILALKINSIIFRRYITFALPWDQLSCADEQVGSTQRAKNPLSANLFPHKYFMMTLHWDIYVVLYKADKYAWPVCYAFTLC